MKRIIIAMLFLACAHAGAQTKVEYALPKSVLVFNVKAEKTEFFAGPYAQFAAKYLGVEVETADKASYSVSEVSLKAKSEADQNSRYSASLTPAARRDYMSLTTQGLVSRPGTPVVAGSDWRFAQSRSADFSAKGLPSNLTQESNILYGKGRASVRQKEVVEKSDEQKAREVADKIFAIREQKYKILVGDTDATYSGEAMKATIDELNRMENEYLTLFTGYSESQQVEGSFEVIPVKGTLLYVAFRVSDEEGLVQADNLAGKPYLLELVPEAIAEAESQPESAPAKKKGKAAPEPVLLHYRIPAICTAKLSDGQATLLQTRVPVYQFGADAVLDVTDNNQTTKK